MTQNTSLSGVCMHACTSTLAYQSAHEIWSAYHHPLKKYDWGKILNKLATINPNAKFDVLLYPVRRYERRYKISKI